MPEQTSHSYLPAKKLREACSLTIDDIRLSKLAVKKKLIEEERSRHFLKFLRTDELVWGLFPEEIKEIVAQHKTDELLRCRALQGLCRAAEKDDPDFRVYVTVTDFTLISKFYGK
jgi:hypothetical protein